MDKKTMCYDRPVIVNQAIRNMLDCVYDALEKGGYNALDQIVGYILSGEPAYITGADGARNMIRHYDRDDIVSELLKSYLGK
ncbi:MAG: IreB family regulatory phosphoprotein [Candidatus Nomurabacteria bacterium]|jgi:uncharacterized protein (UPF0297 family)|nr:IreB family regulatory phosphoprotein [Candidatus Nomurabacteria bacterium]